MQPHLKVIKGFLRAQPNTPHVVRTLPGQRRYLGVNCHVSRRDAPAPRSTKRAWRSNVATVQPAFQSTAVSHAWSFRIYCTVPSLHHFDCRHALLAVEWREARCKIAPIAHCKFPRYIWDTFNTILLYRLHSSTRVLEYSSPA